MRSLTGPIKIPDSGRTQHLHVVAGALLKIICETDDPQEAAKLLIRQAIANNAGDDVTCVLFSIQSDEQRKSPGPTFFHSLVSLFQKQGDHGKEGEHQDKNRNNGEAGNLRVADRNSL